MSSAGSASLVCTRAFFPSPVKRVVRGKDVYVNADVASVDIETDKGTFTHNFAPALVNELPPFDDTIARLQTAVATLQHDLNDAKAKIPTKVVISGDRNTDFRGWNRNRNNIDDVCVGENKVMIGASYGTINSDLAIGCGTVRLVP